MSLKYGELNLTDFDESRIYNCFETFYYQNNCTTVARASNHGEQQMKVETG